MRDGKKVASGKIPQIGTGFALILRRITPTYAFARVRCPVFWR
jgi:hypothetical protein